MAKILIVGCGDLGSAIATCLQQNHEVIGLRLGSLQLPHGMQTIQADVTQPDTLTALEKLNPNFIIYCVSASAQTDENYKAIYVDGLKNILATQQANQQLQHVFFVSSTRVYGQNNSEILDENTPAISVDFGGERLLEAENAVSYTHLDVYKRQLGGCVNHSGMPVGTAIHDAAIASAVTSSRQSG